MQTVFARLFLAAAFISISASAQEGASARAECSAAGSHVETRACLQAKADASARELVSTQDEMFKSLAASDQEPTYIKRSISEFKLSVKQFSRYHAQQCEFIASLAAGGNGQNDLRLSCIYELNRQRISQIQQTKALLK